MIEICKMIWWLALGAVGSLVLIGLGIFMICLVGGLGITIKEEIARKRKWRRK